MLANIVVKIITFMEKAQKIYTKLVKRKYIYHRFLFFSFCVIMTYLNCNLSENYNFLKPNQHTVYVLKYIN